MRYYIAVLAKNPNVIEILSQKRVDEFLKIEFNGPPSYKILAYVENGKLVPVKEDELWQKKKK